jgi:hypothetical protein
MFFNFSKSVIVNMWINLLRDFQDWGYMFFNFSKSVIVNPLL